MEVMRLEEGTKVETLCKNGSWRPAEIISGNGWTYIVKYDSYQRGMAMVTERVPRRFIRPLPPPVDGMGDWSPGDIVEVLEIYSWKVAQVFWEAAGDCYFVKILASSRHIIAHHSELRVWQAWKDNHWVIIQHGAGRFEDGNMVSGSLAEEEVNSPVPQASQELENRAQVPYKDHSGFEKGQRKRRRIFSSPPKLRTRNSLDHTEHNDASSVSSSIGSCSPCGGPSRPYCNPTACPTQDIEVYLSMIDAYRCAIRKLYSAKKDEWAYKLALMKLNSSGAITWKEA